MTDEDSEAEVRVWLGQQLRAARLAAQLSQEVVAQRSGIQQADVSRIEHGEINATLGTIVRLARAVDCDIQRLLNLYTARRVKKNT